MTYPELILNFPPVLIRLLARHRYGPPLTSVEIAERSGKMPDVCNLLSTAEVEAISRETHWKNIRYHDALSFQRGCGLELHNHASVRRVNDYLSRRPTFRYLRISPDWSSYYKPLLVIWRKSYPADTMALPEGLSPHIISLIKRTAILVRSNTT